MPAHSLPAPKQNTRSFPFFYTFTLTRKTSTTHVQQSLYSIELIRYIYVVIPYKFALIQPSTRSNTNVCVEMNVHAAMNRLASSLFLSPSSACDSSLLHGTPKSYLGMWRGVRVDIIMASAVFVFLYLHSGAQCNKKNDKIRAYIYNIICDMRYAHCISCD